MALLDNFVFDEPVEEIHRRMLENINARYNRSKGSFFYDATKPPAIEFVIKNGEINEILKKLDIENLFGDELDRVVYQRTGIRRKQATVSSGEVVFTGIPNTLIKEGSRVASDVAIYETTRDVVIGSSGQEVVYVVCVDSGSIGNASVGVIKNIPISISGVTSVSNQKVIDNGFDKEDDEDLRFRYYDKMRYPGKAGNKYHYNQWATEVQGVKYAQVYPLWAGALTVKVVIIDDNGLPASQELVKSCKDHIESERPFGAVVTVVPAVGVNVNISCKVSKASDVDSGVLKSNIEKNIKNYLGKLAFVDRVVSYARIGGIILSTEGVVDYQDLLINGGNKNINVADEQVAILGGVTI